MIGGMNQVGSTLASVYAQTNDRLADVMSRIASGLKIQKPSDDFSNYVRSNALQGKVSDYERIKQDLMETKEYSSKAVEVATAVYEDLTELRDIADDYNVAAAGGNTDEQKALAAEFLALKQSIANTINNNTDVYATGAMTTVDLDPGTAANNFVVQFATAASQIVSTGDVTALTATAAGGSLGNAASLPGSFTATELANIDTEIINATRFLVSAENMDQSIDRQVNLTDTVINTQKAVISEITEIDDAEELAKQTDLTIRTQASISMIAQANASRQGILQLFT